MANVLLPHVARIRIPLAEDKVHKDEAAFSFDTPESEDGLYICMNTFLGLGRRHLDMYFQKTSNAVFLRIKRTRREIVMDAAETEAKKPTRLAIGLEGGFDAGERKYDVEEFFSIVVLPDWTEFPLSFPDLPNEVVQSATAIIQAPSASRQAELAAMAGVWDGEKREVSKFAENLQQINAGKRIPPSGWTCEKCDLKDNLWLNLTDGAILCGRKFWDGTGGNHHAIEHYEHTQNPLAVKLGTITPEGADVYSYPEDDMVVDPLLPQHLAHFGIDILKMEKTDRTIVEMELDLNQQVWEWNALQESGSKLQPVYGPGFTGIYNLGNSCYMNSIMQVMFTLPSFVERYCKPAMQIFIECNTDPTADFVVQMAKFGHGLLSGDYSKPPTDAQAVQLVDGIRPQMFRTLIGRGHQEFATSRQQDAVEFLMHMITNVERNSRGAVCPTDCLKFGVEDRIECSESHKVKYMYRDEYMLSLPIPLDKAINNIDVATYEQKKAILEAQNKQVDPSEVVRPRIKLSSCLEAFGSPALVDRFYSPATKSYVMAKKTTLMSTFPDYLLIHMGKFTIGEDWIERKLDVSIEVPDELDIKYLRALGKQPGEEELPDEQQQQPPPAELNIDQGLVMQLVDMGFPLEACKKAVYNTNNSGIEMASNWVMEHMDDPDFAEPLQVPGSRQVTDSFVANDAAVVMIMAMGFTKAQATLALKSTENDVERAADWIFSHPMELDNVEETAPNVPAASQTIANTDGHGKYRLLAFVSHMGTSTKCGHYVCHILKEGRWIIFNDDKVALSENPPKDLAYLYVYQRI